MQKSLFSFIPFLLLIVPVMEIGVFILVGGQIGVINTLLGVVLTAFLGTILLRQQGFALIGQAQKQMDQGKIPGKELAHGVMLLAAGLLLLTPGFVTDTIGFLLLVPPIRESIFYFFKSRISVAGMHASGAGFESHTFSSGRGGSYQEHRSYRRTDSTSSKRPAADIIDLDEEEFSEVSDKEAIENKTSGQSPWGK